jgi:hypothetical protein
VKELAKQGLRLKEERGVHTVAVQAAKVDKKTLDDWVKEHLAFPSTSKYTMPLAIGMVENNELETRLSWGVKSLPWLILTDKNNVVTAEGFGLQALDEKTKSSNVKVAKTPEPGEAEAANRPEFSATLANGVTVELLGVCEHPSEGKRWWRADGSLLEESPYDDDFGRAFPKDGERGYKFAAKFSGMAGKEVDVHIEPTDFRTTNGGGLFCTSKKSGKENTKYVEGSLDQKTVWLGAAFDEKLGHCDVKIGVCEGDWKDHYRYETDQPGDAVEWVKFKNVSLRAGVKTVVVVGGRPLAGMPLPKFDGLGVKTNSSRTKNKRILACFFDYRQRPSRHVVGELAKRVDSFKEKGIEVICVQTSKIESGKLNEWVQENRIPFTVGAAEGDEEDVCCKWGVKSLPWLILTDRSHIVTGEGFALEELEDQIKTSQSSQIVQDPLQSAKKTWKENYGSPAEGSPAEARQVGEAEMAIPPVMMDLARHILEKMQAGRAKIDNYKCLTVRHQHQSQENLAKLAELLGRKGMPVGGLEERTPYTVTEVRLAIDNEGRGRFERLAADSDAEGNVISKTERHVSTWDGQKAISYVRSLRYEGPGSTTIRNEKPFEMSNRFWRPLTAFGGNFCDALAKAVEEGANVQVEEEGDTYRVAVAGEGNIEQVAVIDPGQGYCPTLQEIYRDGVLQCRYEAKF